MVCRDFILPEICKPCPFLFLRNLFYLIAYRFDKQPLSQTVHSLPGAAPDGLITSDKGKRVLPPEVDLVGRENVRALYETVFGILSPMERRVFELYLSGASYKAMAVSLGLGVKSVDNAVARIKAKIKRSVSIR